MPEDRAHILLIDDEEPFCQVTVDLLELKGHRASYALSAEQGLVYIRQNPDLDLILLDIDLGEGMNGIEALALFVENFPFIPVIMVTSQKTLQVGLECMKKGAFDFLPKPFNQDNLFKILPQALEKKRLAQLSSLYLEIIVHDLNNPLHNILMGLDALEQRAAVDEARERESSLPVRPPEEARKAFSMAKYGCWQIRNMIANLISIGQLEKQSLAAQWETFAVETEVQEQIQPLITRCRFTEKKFVFHCALEKGYPLTTSKFLFGRVVTNLVANALNSTRKGDTITLDIEQAAGHFLSVRVTNTGSFIEEASREKVFDKFYKVSASGGPKGYNFGLGLTFCRLAVQAMGGEIRVSGEQSIPATTFAFSVKNQT